MSHFIIFCACLFIVLLFVAVWYYDLDSRESEQS